MALKLPYETNFGSKIFNSNIENELFKYLNTIDTKKLEYEYISDHPTKLLFILGINDVERSLPLFDHPMLIKNVKNNDVMVVDCRKYVKPLKELDADVLKIADVAKDILCVDSIVNRGMLTIDYYHNNFEVTSAIVKEIMSSFIHFIAHIIQNICALTPAEDLLIKLLINIYTTALMTNNDDVGSIIESAATKASLMKVCGNMDRIQVVKLYDKIKLDSAYNTYGKTTDFLVELIKAGLPEEKRNFITTSILLNAVNNSWYGPGGNEAVIISLEHMPTWISIVGSASTDITFKKSRLSTILLKYDRSIKLAEINKLIINYNKRHKLV